MGTAASADLIRITERWGEKFPSDALSRLLRWGRRGGLSVQSSSNTVWERLGCELWKSVAQGDKKVFSLSPVWLTAQRRLKEQFLQQKVMVEAYQRDASSQDQLISELKSTKKRLDLEVKELKRELLKLRSEKQSIDVECSRLQKEVSQVHQQIVELESHLQSVQKERDAQIADGGNNQVSHERIQALEIELQAVSHSKMMSEKELQEVISLTSQELRESRRKIKLLEEINKKLALELEHERGKLTGFGQSNIALREHSTILETVLAEREADLVQLNLRVQAVLNIQALQTAFEREKSNVNNLQKQVAAAKVDAAHNRRHYRAAVLELSEIKKELQAKELLVQTLQAEADKLHAIIECAHASFKALLLRQKGGICSERADALDKTPAARLLQALNWLHLGKNSQVPPAIKHVNGMTGEEQGAAPRPSVKWFDYQQQIWKGPVDLLTWGRGYVCVATDAGPRWMPARWVRPWLRPPE